MVLQNLNLFCINDQVVGANKGGVVALVEGLRAFVPFSQVSTVSSLSLSLMLTDLPIMYKNGSLIATRFTDRFNTKDIEIQDAPKNFSEACMSP